MSDLVGNPEDRFSRVAAQLNPGAGMSVATFRLMLINTRIMVKETHLAIIV